MQYVLEAKLWEGGMSGLERLWVRPLEVQLTGVGAFHLFACLTLRSYI